jgi:lysophospholipase L1-like esterase
MEERSPGFQQNVRLYNEALAEQASQPRVTLIDINGAVKTNGGSIELTCDGVHLNERGHQILANELDKHISSLMGQQERVSPATTTIT